MSATPSSSGSPLRAVLFCEFDNSVGRTLAFQEPAGFMTADEFDAISEFLIPKPQLCGRLLVLREEGRVVLCWPVCIEDPRYDRNALLFSLVFVLEPGAAGAPERFGHVLEKASRHLEVLEKESRLLSGGSREVQHMLPQLLHDLRKHGRCSVAVDASNTLELCLSQPMPRPAAAEQMCAQDHLAPVLVAVPDAALVRGWDLTLQKLLPHLDGTRTVASIAAAVGGDLPLVRRALDALARGGWVRLLDAFAFSNAYACTPRLAALAHAAPAAQQAAAEACARSGAPPPAMGSVLKLLSAFQPQPQPQPGGEGWRSVLAVCTLHADLCECVDIRRPVPSPCRTPPPHRARTHHGCTSHGCTYHGRLVQYAVLNRVLRRVHAFPLAQPTGVDASPHVGPLDEWRMMPRSVPSLPPGTLLDGRRHMDSLCCEMEAPLAAAERAVLEAFPDCVWVHR